MAKLYYKRVWRPPSPTITGASDFKKLFNKRKLAELRATVESGEWQQQFSSDSDTDEPSKSSTSCTLSPKSGRSAGLGQELCSKSPGAAAADQQQLQSTAEQEQAEAARQAESARRQAAAEQKYHEILAKLSADQIEDEERKLAEKVQLEAEHAEASRRMVEVQQRLDELRQHKHDLVKQLKQAMQEEEAAKQQAALQQQQQLQMQMQLQQQEQWAAQQQQQQQHAPHRGLTPLGIPPGPMHFSAAHTPGAAGRPGVPSAVTPGAATGSYTASGGHTPGHTPAGSYTPGSALFSPGSVSARSQWLFSTPNQPPPPPPRQQLGDPAASSSNAATAAAAAAAAGQPGQQQQPRSGTWGQPPAPPRSFGPAGADTHAAGCQEVHMQDASRPGSDAMQQQQQLQQQQSGQQGSWQQQDQHSGGASTPRAGVARSPRQSYNGSRPWHSSGLGLEGHHQLEPPDSPEEGEALPSPKMPGQSPRMPGLPHRSAAAAAAGSRADALPAAHSVPSRAEGGAAEPSSSDRPGPAWRTSSSGGGDRSLDRERDRDRDSDRAVAEYGRPGGLLRTSSGGTSASGFSGDQPHRPGLLRTSSGVPGTAAGSMAAPPPLLSPGSGSAAAAAGGYRGMAGLGRSQSASLPERDHPGAFRAGADRSALDRPLARDGLGGAYSAIDGLDAAGRSQRGVGPYGASNSQYYGTGSARGAEDIGPAWRGERRRSSSANIDRFVDDSRQLGAGPPTGYMGDAWQGDAAAGAAGDRSHPLWGRGGCAAGADRGGGAGGHGDGVDRKPWSRHPGRGGAWR